MNLLQRIRGAVMQFRLATPEQASARQMEAIFRRGRPGARIRALRVLGVRGEVVPDVHAHLRHAAPGVRAAAAWTWGRCGGAPAELLACAEVERVDHARLAFAVAAVRAGASVREAWAVLLTGAEREMMTWYGPKHSGYASGLDVGVLTERWTQALAPGSHGDAPDLLQPEPSRAIRLRLGAALDADPDDAEAIGALAAQQHPGDYEQLSHKRPGRRVGLLRVSAMGLLGDPRALPSLVKILSEPDLNPGRGIARRRAAAEALGQLGDPAAGAALARALEVEALEHEGRPGSGLGVQFPVRTSLLVALGECGAVQQAPIVGSYLGNTHGSAMGGFYLPAMDSLWKLEGINTARAQLSYGEVAAANAAGVLGALGVRSEVAALVDDPRPKVAEVARAVLEHSPL